MHPLAEQDTGGGLDGDEAGNRPTGAATSTRIRASARPNRAARPGEYPRSLAKATSGERSSVSAATSRTRMNQETITSGTATMGIVRPSAAACRLCR